MTRIIIAAFISLFAFAAFAEEETGIGFDSVADALASLQENPDASIRTQDGWTIVNVQPNDEADVEMELWSFTPEGHPAHPAAVKREIVSTDGAIHIRMKVLCQADKQSCDELVEQFKELNEAILSQSGG